MLWARLGRLRLCEHPLNLLMQMSLAEEEEVAELAHLLQAALQERERE